VNKRIIPVLLLSNNALCKSVRFKDHKYIGDPINAVRIFSEKEADEIAFLDIDATKKGLGPNYEFIKDISSEAFMPFSYGGGITNLFQAEKVLKHGCEKLIINNSFQKDSKFADELIKEFGSSTIVCCIDIKKNMFGTYQVYSYYNKRTISENFESYVNRCEDTGFGEVVIQSVNNDGKREGYDKSLIEKSRKIISSQLVSLGGAGNINDLKEAISIGVDAAAAGSLFSFHGKYRAVLISYPTYEEIKAISFQSKG